MTETAPQATAAPVPTAPAPVATAVNTATTIGISPPTTTTATPVLVTAPAPAPVATPAPAAAPAAPGTEEPDWLKGRLERAAASARAQALTELGVTDLASAKAAIELAKKAEEANKSSEQRALEAMQRETVAKTEAERLTAIAREHASRMMAVLSVKQQEAVRALAPDTDPAGQLKAIGVLGPTWQAEVQPLPAGSIATPQAAPAAPATTAPPPTAPGSVTVAGSPPDHKQVYSSMRSANPFAAAAYGQEHPSLYDQK